MSVEDAKVAFADAIDDACTERDHDLLGRAIASDERVTDAIDRLILEVQAAMPCYHEYACGDDCDHYGVACPGYEDGRIDTPRLCPSCTARMKLKETADAR